MSLPHEIVNAQERVWKAFVNGELPRKYWPKHFAAAVQLKMIYDEIEGLKRENERWKALATSLFHNIEETEKLKALLEILCQGVDCHWAENDGKNAMAAVMEIISKNEK